MLVEARATTGRLRWSNRVNVAIPALSDVAVGRVLTKRRWRGGGRKGDRREPGKRGREEWHVQVLLSLSLVQALARAGLAEPPPRPPGRQTRLASRLCLDFLSLPQRRRQPATLTLVRSSTSPGPPPHAQDGAGRRRPLAKILSIEVS